MYALRHKGSAVIPEHRLYFSLTAANLLAPPPNASETVKLAAAAKGTAIVNAAVPGQIEDTVVCLNGLAVVDNATVVRPQGLDNALWAAGGTSLLLEWVEKAATARELELAAGVLVEALSDSWRLNEEAGALRFLVLCSLPPSADLAALFAEERHAYEILALHLRKKAGLVTAVVHDSILQLAGFDVASPARSVVSNTLAFQHLVLDFYLWRETDLSIQMAHFDRLRDLVTTSEAAEFNLRKLSKLRTSRPASRPASGCIDLTQMRTRRRPQDCLGPPQQGL